MTKLLEQALSEASKLSEADQDAIAAEILAKVKAKQAPVSQGNLSDEPFFGLWRDRADLEDSTAWVREHRQQEWSR